MERRSHNCQEVRWNVQMQVYSGAESGFRVNRLADTNMVIENLKQSKAVMTNPQQLMKRLSDGMNNLCE